jgi:phosphoglycerate dehydrogenase-like enzyme
MTPKARTLPKLPLVNEAVGGRFRVVLSWDFVDSNGDLVWGEDLGVDQLKAAPDLVEWDIMKASGQEITPAHIVNCDGLILLALRVTANTFSSGAKHLTIIGRHGVGYDSVDVAACTANGVALFTTPQTSRHPVATAALTFILTLSRRVIEKDRLVREGRWTQRNQCIGHEIREKTLGIIGLGNIGQELVRLVAPFEMKILAHDPYLLSGSEPKGVRMVSLEQLLRESDYVSLHCPLTERTRHLLNDSSLRLMKRDSYLINLARGPIIDQVALARLLAERRIAGAALDVFDPEPIKPDDPLLTLDNVLLSPHTAAVSVEGFLAATLLDCKQMVRAARGEVPDNIVNREVLKRADFQAKLARFQR